jgi:hypothetical protein
LQSLDLKLGSGKAFMSSDFRCFRTYPLQEILPLARSLTGPGDDTGLVQISAPVQPGNSGGPLLDRRGNVVGVIVARIKKLQNVNFAIKSSIALNFLSSNGVGAKESETTASELPPEEIADVAKPFTVRILCYTTPSVALGDRSVPPPPEGNPCADKALKRTYWMHPAQAEPCFGTTHQGNRIFRMQRMHPANLPANLQLHDQISRQPTINWAFNHCLLP